MNPSIPIGTAMSCSLSDVLGTDGDTVMRPMEEDVDHQLLRQALERSPRAGKTIVLMRFGLEGRVEKDPERGGGSDGDFPILHLPPGKANYGAVETGRSPGRSIIECSVVKSKQILL